MIFVDIPFMEFILLWYIMATVKATIKAIDIKYSELEYIEVNYMEVIK